MRIYDRYGGSPQRAEEDRRRDYIHTCLKPVKCACLCTAVLALVWMLAPLQAFGTAAVCAAIFMYYSIRWDCLYSLRQNDLCTFGFDGREFALLGMNGRVRRAVEPGELRQIAIRRARRACWRTRIRRRHGYAGALFTRCGERRLVNGEKRFVAEPMALLEPIHPVQDKAKTGWEDAPMDVFLYSNIGFVVGGENRDVFISLLRNSACPVAIRREFYTLHRRRLDELFAQSGMDMSRLIIEEEES